MTKNMKVPKFVREIVFREIKAIFGSSNLRTICIRKLTNSYDIVYAFYFDEKVFK